MLALLLSFLIRMPGTYFRIMAQTPEPRLRGLSWIETKEFFHCLQYSRQNILIEIQSSQHAG